MNESGKNEITPIENTQIDLIQNENQLITQIKNAKTKEELEPLYQQFNINNTKKNAIRISQLSDLLDKVNQQAIERFTKRPDEISNKEVIDYMNAIQNQIERSQKIVDGVKDINAVQVNNTQNNTINLTMGSDKDLELNKESRNKIANIIKDILNGDKKSEFIDVNLESEEDVESDCIIDTNDDNFIGDE